MFTSFSLYQSFSSLANTAQGSFFRPQTDFIIQSNDVSIEVWDYLTRKAEKSQQERDYLRPFLKTKNIIVKRNNTFYGTLIPPPLYERFSAARIMVHQESKKTIPDRSIDNGKCESNGIISQFEISEEYYENIIERPIDLIDDQKWGACLEHLTKKPTLSKPKMNQIDLGNIGTGFRVAPRTVSVVVLDYYVKPDRATFVYTISPGNEQTGAGDDIIYDAANSKPFNWPETVVPEFLWRLAQRYGIFIDKEIIYNFATQQRMQNTN